MIKSMLVRWLMAAVSLLVLVSFGMAQCGPNCKCPPDSCPYDCPSGCLRVSDKPVVSTGARGERTSYCFTANLFGALVSIPVAPVPRYFIYTPPVGADPQHLLALQRIQDQQCDIKQQMILDRQSTELWRQHQTQLQVIQAQNQAFLAALQSGNANTAETRQLVNQLIVNQQALLGAIQNQHAAPPTVITPAVTPAVTPGLTPGRTGCPTCPPEATSPSTSYSTRRSYLRPRSPLEIILGIR